MHLRPVTDTCWRERFDRDGFAMIDRVLSQDQVAELIEVTRTCLLTPHAGVLERDGEVYGVRDPRLAGSRGSPAGPVAGADGNHHNHLGTRSVRGARLYFDKTISTNWNLPWHQDLTIAVRARRDVAGFGPWTLKAGIQHVHAPAHYLERMVTLRLHLDECSPQSGPMRVLPGSHTEGKLDAKSAALWSARASELAFDCVGPAGGAVVMRPLLMHASASGTAAGHRRVIHLEYAAESLPGGLEWYQDGIDAKSAATAN